MSDILLSAVNAKYVHPSLALRLLRANLGEFEARSEIVEFALRQPLEERLQLPERSESDPSLLFLRRLGLRP